MAAQRFLAWVTDKISMVAAIVTSAGAADEGKIPCLDANGSLDITFMPSGIGAATAVIPASEALADGDWVNIWSDSGAVKARKADATTVGKPADGFVKAAVNQAANATVYLSGLNDHLSTLTDGAEYFMSVTAGVASATCPSSAGNVAQSVGKAVSDTAIDFKRGIPITIA